MDIPGLKVSKILAIDEWKSWCQNLQNFTSFAYDLLPFEQESVANLYYRVITHFLESQEMQSRPRCHGVPVRCYYEQSQWKYKEGNICCGRLQLRQLFCHCQELWV